MGIKAPYPPSPYPPKAPYECRNYGLGFIPEGRLDSVEGVFLGFGVPYFNTFFLKGNHYEIEVYTFFSLVT